ncbi:NADPH-dependent FMN reductase [Chryseobacterium sp.]|uniref:NADPH-dependent FMN reductase n=1 Tax=Chryseobacterium sp. TaxID=1871047 RepID=UPI0025B9793F|nr:NADPH-dependent FMN reductase [Chryseobacterium sp.]
MPDIVMISGSPEEKSKSHNVLKTIQQQFQYAELTTKLYSVRNFPAEDILYGQYNSSAFDELKYDISEAHTIIIGTPIYKGAYTGILKALLDLLPQYALRGKRLLPIATAGSMAHLLAIDFAIKPLLSVLGSSEILPGIYIPDENWEKKDSGENVLGESIKNRLNRAIEDIVMFHQKIAG